MMFGQKKVSYLQHWAAYWLGRLTRRHRTIAQVWAIVMFGANPYRFHFGEYIAPHESYRAGVLHRALKGAKR